MNTNDAIIQKAKADLVSLRMKRSNAVDTEFQALLDEKIQQCLDSITLAGGNALPADELKHALEQTLKRDDLPNIDLGNIGAKVKVSMLVKMISDGYYSLFYCAKRFEWAQQKAATSVVGQGGVLATSPFNDADPLDAVNDVQAETEDRLLAQAACIRAYEKATQEAQEEGVLLSLGQMLENGVRMTDFHRCPDLYKEYRKFEASMNTRDLRYKAAKDAVAKASPSVFRMI